MPSRSDIISELKRHKVKGALSKMKKSDLAAKLADVKAQQQEQEQEQVAATPKPKPKKPKPSSSTIELEPEPSAPAVLTGGTYASFVKENLKQHGGDMRKTAAAWKAHKEKNAAQEGSGAAHDAFMETTHAHCKTAAEEEDGSATEPVGELQEATDDYCDQFLQDSGYWDTQQDENVPDGYAEADEAAPLDEYLEGGAYWHGDGEDDDQKKDQQRGEGINWGQILSDAGQYALMMAPMIGGVLPAGDGERPQLTLMTAVARGAAQ